MIDMFLTIEINIIIANMIKFGLVMGKVGV